MPAFIVPRGGAQGLRSCDTSQINQSSPQTVGLVAAVSGNLGTRNVVRPSSPLTGTTARRGVLAGGSALQFNAVGQGTEITLPESLKIAFPISVDAWVIPLGGTVSAYAGVFGSVHNNTASGPYFCYAICASNPSGKWSILTNSGGSWGGSPQTQLDSTAAWVTGQLTHVVGTFNANRKNLYVNGALDATNTTACASPTYSATSLLFAGNFTGVSRISNLLFLEGRVWNRELSASDVQQLYNPATRWDLYYVPGRRVFFDLGATPIGRTSRLSLMGVA